MRIALVARANLFNVPGGDTVQIEATCHHLLELGIAAAIYTNPTPQNLEAADIIHFFNLGRPEELLRHWAIVQNKILVISALYVDYSITNLQMKQAGLLQKTIGKQGVEYVKTLARVVKGQVPLPPRYYLYNGQKKSIVNILRHASLVVTSTEKEAFRIQQDFQQDFRNAVLTLGVRDEFDLPEAPLVRSGILCVGRIEPLKNQHTLIEVCVKNKWPLTLVGRYAPNHKAYFEMCKQKGGDYVQFMGQQTPKELAALYQKYQVHVLPSFFETFNLATLEALVCGCNAILSTATDAEEVYENAIQYVPPTDKNALAIAISKSLENPLCKTVAKKFKDRHQWKNIVTDLVAHYNQLLY